MMEFRPLKKLRRAASPTREFTRELWRTLSTAYDREYGAERRTVPLLRFAAVGLSALVLVFGMGSGVYAYGSPDVIEGHPLYAVKQGLEQVEGMMATTPEARARFHTKMMGRRMNEASHALSQETQAQDLLVEAAEELEMSVEELKSGLKDPETRQDIVEQLSEQNAGYAKLLQRVPPMRGQGPMGGRLPPALREKLGAIQEDIGSSDLSEEEKRTLFRGELQKLLLEERENN